MLMRNSAPGDYRPDTPEKEIVYRYMTQGWGQGDMQAIDEVVAEDVLDHDPFPGQQPGREGWKQAAQMIRRVMPDIQIQMLDMVQEGERVTARYLAYGTFTNEFQGRLPTGQPMLIRGIGIEHVRGGLMHETHRVLAIEFDYAPPADPAAPRWDVAAAAAAADEAALAAVEAALAQAVLGKDEAAAAAVLTDDFQAVGHVGNVVSKQEYLDIHFAPERDFTKFDIRNARRSVSGDLAIVVGDIESVNAKIAKNPPPERFLAVYVRTGGAWKIRSWQETPISNDAF